MDIKKHQKTPAKFICIICDFKCSRNAEYIRHLSTGKHQSQSQRYQQDIKKHQKNTENLFSCDNCGNKYKFYSGLWRHKKMCEQTNLQLIKKETEDNELIMMLIKQNTELLDIVKNGTNINNNNNSNNNINNNNNNNNNNNKTFNLQFFLNETCKDAMNINEFVENITIQLSDLIKVGELGYVDGISNIITSSLKSLDVTQRPIHCTDKKREVLYVKEEDKWEKENDEKTKIRKVIKTVAHKNINALPQFNEKYPDCKQSHSQYSDQYNKIIIETMGGFGENNIEKENNIIKNISKNVIVDKENNDV
jgi:hypothetical protein